MAKKIVTTTEFIDDIDGGSAAETVTFSYAGTNYEIDLSKKNKSALEKAIKPYIESARKVRSARPRGKATRASGTGKRTDLAAVREWARANDYEISDRGRVPASITEAYDAAT